MQIRRRLLAATMALLLVGATGCWDHRELEESAFILAFGLDRGQREPMRVTAMMAVPREMLGPAGKETEKVMVTSLEAPTVMEAINLMNSYVERQVSLLHTKVMVVGEEAARGGILEYSLDPLQRVRELRRNVLVIVVRGTAREFLQQVRSVIEKDPGRHLELMPMVLSETGMVPRFANVHTLSTGLEHQGIDPVVFLAAVRTEDSEPEAGAGGTDGATAWLPGALPRQGGPNLELIGGAVIRLGRMVGELSGQEMRLRNLVVGNFVRGIISVPDAESPERRIPIELRRGRTPRVQVAVDGPVPRVQVLVNLEAVLLGSTSRYDYTEPEKTRQLGAQVAASLEAETRALVEKAQQDWRTDPFGFGLKAARHFNTYPEWLAYDWGERWPGAEVEVKYRVDFRRFGTQLAPPRLKPETKTDGSSGGNSP